MELEILANGLLWFGKIKGENHGTIEFEYVKDKVGDVWLFNMSVHDDLKGNGIGRKMLSAAVHRYGKVYINKMERWDYNNKFSGTGYSSSYLCQDGPGFVNKMIIEGVIQSDWLREPNYPLVRAENLEE